MSAELVGERSTNMIAMCASHISTPARLNTLVYMLESWSNQERLDVVKRLKLKNTRIDLYLSVSTSAEMAASVGRLLDAFEAKYGIARKDEGSVLHIVRQASPLRQFEHYASLAREHTAHLQSQNPWVIFSDDDDLWHPLRAFSYEVHIGRAWDLHDKNGESRSLAYVSITTHARATEGCSFDEHAIKKPDEVTSAIKIGALQIVHENTVGDYVERAVPLSVLRRFVDHPQAAPLLQRKMADVYFVRFLHFCDKKRYYGIDYKDPAMWVYYCRSGMKDRATRTMDAIPDELAADSRFVELCTSFDRSEVEKVLYNMENFSAHNAFEVLTYKKWSQKSPTFSLDRGYQPLVDYVWSTAYFHPLLHAPVLE